jgi:hypothetical protein
VGNYTESGSTFTAEVTFANDGNVKVGMSGTASITLETAENVIAVPVNAVSGRRGQKVVTLLKESGKTEAVEVTTGVENDAFVEIKSGLSEGDTVVVPESEDSNDNRFGGMPGGGDMPGGGMPGGGMAGGDKAGGDMAGGDMAGGTGGPSGAPGNGSGGSSGGSNNE